MIELPTLPRTDKLIPVRILNISMELTESYFDVTVEVVEHVSDFRRPRTGSAQIDTSALDKIDDSWYDNVVLVDEDHVKWDDAVEDERLGRHRYYGVS